MFSALTCRHRKTSAVLIRRMFLPVALFLTIVILFYFRVIPLEVICSRFQDTIENIPHRVLALYQGDPEKILKTAIPLLDWGSFEGDTANRPASRILLDAFASVAGVRFHSPAVILQSQIPCLAAVTLPDPAADQLEAFIPGAVPPVKTTTVLSEEYLVGIYNTHTGETYSRTDGLERLEGKRGGVVTVAMALQGALEEKHGIKVVRSDRIHDANYNTSYLESEKTLREMLAGYPSLKVVLDIHRDSGKTREQSLVQIDGQAAAPILFIVGSDARRPFPNWRQNYDFAVLLSERINQMYPGLSLGVRVKDGLYNQFLHPRAVLVEMGTTENSTEEAARSARLLADALADILAGEATVPEEPGEEPGVEAVWQETWNGRQEPGNLHYGTGIG